MEHQGEIILYQPEEAVKLEVRLDSETVWLNRQQLSILFDRDIKTIGKHINNALKEELALRLIMEDNTTITQNPTVANFATVQKEGNREVVRNIEYYNLDVILSVGYRVKSARGIQFRVWANKVLKEYLLKGYAIHQRVEQLERTVASHGEKIDFFVRTSLPPVEGIFFEGQIFDAYAFATNLVKSAMQTIVLLDNYVDETVLTLLSKRKAKVSADIYTRQIPKQLQLDLAKHNAQYAPVSVSKSTAFHDRFLIIDTTVYHLGASLKDLGKKLFAFSKMDIPVADILRIL